MDVGALIRQARDDARLTQQELAERAGVSRFAISHYESGRRLPTIGGLRAILAATGNQLRAELEPVDADVREAIARVAAMPMADREAVRHWYWFESLAGHDSYRVEGMGAAGLLGAPVPVDDLDLAFADAPGGYATLVRVAAGHGPCQIRARRAGAAVWIHPPDPDDGPRGVETAAARLRDRLRDDCPDGVFWLSAACAVARVRLAPAGEVASYVEVATPHGAARVAPLHQIVGADPQTDRVLRVLRELRAAAGTG
ncbi:XRE family transcriptional regulator [Jiangella aurantiaca]|uniref:XRE family transcriptional regulator n=1 Tax=Jiangella aurantiaca TaxID=2530373 RepID=A0A4R5AA30_9ACTN|nr:helix-turn-helix transcriptional regulator [Jiangella aurantiaca]TDD68110.1 XRE family transcriptional regulator [Jiangella aurantiaca]